MKKKILFHICCGPCSTATVTKLLDDGYEPMGFYFNPNIYPKAEYERRLFEAKRFAEETGVQFVVPKHNPNLYTEAVCGFENDQEERCRHCWELRLRETARLTKELGYAHFGTSLRISPYQNQVELLKLAKQIAGQYDLNFYDMDLTSCYRESIDMSKERNMYRQKYCGCRYSLKKV